MEDAVGTVLQAKGGGAAKPTAVARPSLRRWRDLFNLGLVWAGGRPARSDRQESVGYVGTARSTRIMAAVLRFLSRQDEDLPDVCPPCSGRSVEFQKAPSANFHGG